MPAENFYEKSVYMKGLQDQEDYRDVPIWQDIVKWVIIIGVIISCIIYFN